MTYQISSLISPIQKWKWTDEIIKPNEWHDNYLFCHPTAKEMERKHFVLRVEPTHEPTTVTTSAHEQCIFCMMRSPCGHSAYV